MTRQEALMELLSRPDEPCLAGKREYFITCPSETDPEIVKRDLGRAYLLQRWHAHKDISTVVHKKSPKIKIVARRA